MQGKRDSTVTHGLVVVTLAECACCHTALAGQQRLLHHYGTVSMRCIRIMACKTRSVDASVMIDDQDVKQGRERTLIESRLLFGAFFGVKEAVSAWI